MTARAITPNHPATILPAPEEAVLEAVVLEPVAELLDELPEAEVPVEEAVEEESVAVAVAVDEPVVVLLALGVVVVVATAVVSVDTLDSV